MENNYTVSDVVSEFKNMSNDFEKNDFQFSEVMEQNEENMEINRSEMNNFFQSNSRSSSTNTSYQDLPSLVMEKDKSDFLNSVNETHHQLKQNSELKTETEFPEAYSVHKFESIDSVYDVQKDISQSKVLVELSINGELNPYEKYKFKEDFYSLCKNSPRYYRPNEVVYDSFDSCRNLLKESNKNLNSDYQWDMQRYSDFRCGLNSTERFRYDKKLESTPVKRDTSKSAFETDPDLLFFQSNQSYAKEHISPLTKKYLSSKNVQINENNLKPKTEINIENDFMNMCSFKTKKNIDEKFKESSVLNETIESEHLYSDYAKGPVFPLEAYGTRPGIESGREGIYTRQKKDVKINIPEPIKDESLDSNQLKNMDKKLKKLIKKNFKEDLKSHIVDLQLKPETVSWEIPHEKKCSTQNNFDESISTNEENNVSNSVPYLPLRDVPVHELVKKLRHEFELEGDLSCVPSDLNDVYLKFHSEPNQFKNCPINEPKNKLENLVKNPAKTFIQNEESEKQTDQEKGDCSKNVKKNHTNFDKKFISKKLIEQQKKEHEKRIKELENLVKLEKLQVQTLQKILKMKPNDSMYAETYQDYIEKQNVSPDKQLEKYALTELDKNIDKSFYDETQSKIENQISDNESFIEEEEEFEHENHNQAHRESGIESSESNSEIIQEKKSHDRNKISSWFCPIQPVKQVESKPALKEKKGEIFEVKLEGDKNEEPIEKKFGLQEAFQIYKYDFLKNSRNRVKEIKIKAARRQVAKDLKLDTLEQLNAKFARNYKTLKQRQNQEDNEKKINYFTIDKAMFTKNRHVLSLQEMVEQTKKKYQKLPEVQQKKHKQKLEESKVRNRIKSNIFKKTIQQKVLSSGPNFNLDFKALENQI